MLTLSLSCPYLGMLYLIVTPPSKAALERNKDEVMNLIIRRSEITYVSIEIKFTDLSSFSFNGDESNEVWLSECKADNLYTVHDQRSLKCFSPLNRIQVNSPSLGLAIDIDNPLASLGGVLIRRNYFGMLPTQLTH